MPIPAASFLRHGVTLSVTLTGLLSSQLAGSQAASSNLATRYNGADEEGTAMPRKEGEDASRHTIVYRLPVTALTHFRPAVTGNR